MKLHYRFLRFGICIWTVAAVVTFLIISVENCGIMASEPQIIQPENPQQNYGMFADPRLDAPFSPTGRNSRFSSSGAIMGPMGEIRGINLDGTNSLFRPRSAVPPFNAQDYFPSGGAPPMYPPPNRFAPVYRPDAAGAQSSAVRQPGMLSEGAAGPVQTVQPEEFLRSSPEFPPAGQPSERWFRDRTPESTLPFQNTYPLYPQSPYFSPQRRESLSNPTATPSSPSPSAIPSGGGALPVEFGPPPISPTMIGGTSNPSTVPQMSTSDSGFPVDPRALRAIEERLEEQVFSHPTINPLSPIQVTIRGGVATIRGVVPTQQARMDAGRVLLASPGVRTVNNQLSVLNP